MPLDSRELAMKVRLRLEREKVRVAVKCTKARKLHQCREKTENGCVLTHVTCYAAGNSGDTALSECVRRTFLQRFGPINWQLRQVVEPVDAGTVQQINACDGLLIGGGGLFLPDTNANTVSGWQWACSKEDLAHIDVPVILYSVGYNYFRGQKPSALFIDSLNAVIEKSAFTGLRNSGSIREVRALLREDLREKVRYQPCTTTLIREIMQELPPKKESGRVAFNFAFDRADMRYGGRQEEILQQIVQSMYMLRDKGYEVCLVAHCVRDLSALAAIRDRKGIRIVDTAAWDLNRLAAFYNGVDVVLGMRGHAQMIPFGVNCHIISLGSHEKMRWFLEDINATDWYVELTQDIPGLADRITEKFADIHERNGAKTTQRIMEAQKALSKITDENMESIRALVDGARGGITSVS